MQLIALGAQRWATAPALLFVAVLMASGLAEIDWKDVTTAAPVTVTALTMPLTYSIANGIAFGFITWTVVKLLSGREKMGRALIADSAAALFGSLLGTSTTTSYVESAAGVSAGGRTGLTAIVVAVLFLLSLFFSPLAGSVPGTPFGGVFSAPPSIAPTFMQLDIAGAFNVGLVSVIFAFLFVDVFDNTGTLLGVTKRAGLADEQGNVQLIALEGAGIVVDNPATLVGLGDLTKPGPLLALLGFFIIVVLEARRVTGAVLIGILVVTFISMGIGRMGLNAFFTYTVVLHMGYTWQIALGAVFLSAVIFFALSIFKIREWIIASIPLPLRAGIAAGIGLFLATTVRTEIVAGITTFLAMAYILFVNPSILGATGMDKGAVFVATCLAAAIGSILMGLIANYPIALAPVRLRRRWHSNCYQDRGKRRGHLTSGRLAFSNNDQLLTTLASENAQPLRLRS
ncbi:hypothetical protein CRX72_21120 [Pantoea sp. BRM17]|nr:hypothetical protein CRX72_21120 [Pantoea sp. BRM17]